MQIRLIALIGVMAFLVSFVTFAQPGNAQATLTLNNLFGCETNGLDEAIASAGTPVCSTTQLRTGDWSLEHDGGTDNFDIAMITGGSTDSDNDFIVGFAFRTTANTLREFFIALDDSSGQLWFVQLESDGDLTLANAESSLVVTTTSQPISANTWHIIEIRWQHLASGAFDLHVDSVSEISETGVDLTDGGAISADAAVYRFDADTTSDFYFDDFYAYSGGTGTGDFLGDPEVFRYQAGENNTTRDRGIGGGGSGNDLDQGVWQDLGETPVSSDGTEPGYTNGGAVRGAKDADDTQSGDNFRPGPLSSPDNEITGTIKGGKWYSRLRRENGSGTTHFYGTGNTGDGDGMSSTTITLETGFANFFTILTTASVPTTSEDFSLGFGKGSGGREIFSEEQFGFLLHVPDAGGAPRRIFPVQ